MQKEPGQYPWAIKMAFSGEWRLSGEWRQSQSKQGRWSARHMELLACFAIAFTRLKNMNKQRLYCRLTSSKQAQVSFKNYEWVQE